jgi:uncharacterized phage protein (TIGR02218 family)
MAGMLEGPLTSVALCWCLERADGAGLALTSHDSALIIAGVTYEAAPGMLPAAIQRRAGIEPDGSEVAGCISSASLDEEDLALGRWDGARASLVAADWIAGAGEVPLLRGELGEIQLEGVAFKAELRGAAARQTAPICPETSPECRAELGDKKCRVDLAGRTVAAEILEVDGRTLVIDQSVSSNFLWGRARFLSGANCGLASVLVSADADRIELRDSARGEVRPGDRIELRHGCDKSFATCSSRFDNAANFRGEPHLPGNDLLTRYPGA